jgi:hypothetical protein
MVLLFKVGILLVHGDKDLINNEIFGKLAKKFK